MYILFKVQLAPKCGFSLNSLDIQNTSTVLTETKFEFTNKTKLTVKSPSYPTDDDSHSDIVLSPSTLGPTDPSIPISNCLPEPEYPPYEREADCDVMKSVYGEFEVCGCTTVVTWKNDAKLRKCAVS